MAVHDSIQLPMLMLPDLACVVSTSRDGVMINKVHSRLTSVVCAVQPISLADTRINAQGGLVLCDERQDHAAATVHDAGTHKSVYSS